MKKKNLIIIIVLMVVIVAAGVMVMVFLGKDKDDTSMKTMPANSSNKSTTTEPATPAAATSSISIKDFTYTPAVVTVKVGTKVTWTNTDAVRHTVTADVPSADAPSSELFKGGESYSFTFTKAGVYAYHCTPHDYMKGVVTVTE